MSYWINTTNDPQEDWDAQEELSENCPVCGSDRKEASHYNPNEDTTTYRCLDCDEFFDI